MSKTDKDRPFWVKQNDSSLLRQAYHDHVDYWGNEVECDIHLPTVREDKYRVDRNCGYDIVAYYAWADSPSRRIRHTEWFGPVRAKTRDSMLAQAKEYNTYGEIYNDSTEPGDHRNAPIKGYWY
jgi:hypothetical protein